MAMVMAAIEAQVEIVSVQPMAKPGYSPRPRRAMTYMPPDLGIIAPGSARVRAPSNA